MSKRFFENYPSIIYKTKVARNLLVKTNFYKEVLASYQAFYPYIVKVEDMPSTIAYHYYGDTAYEWLVYFSNQIINPYFEWIMNDSEFEDYLINKYGSVEAAFTTAHHFEYREGVDPDDEEAEYKKTYWMSRDTFNDLSVQQKSFWKPIYCYEYEHNLNESRRVIQLIDNDLLPQINTEISKIFLKA